MKVNCFSVRLKSLVPISAKAYVAEDFNGNEDIIPASQVFGQDWDVINSEAWWISEWILQKKKITYSNKKEAMFDTDTREKQYRVLIHKHIPEVLTITNNPDEFKR